MSIVLYEEVPAKEREVIESVLDELSADGALEVTYRGLHGKAVWAGRSFNGRRLRIMEYWGGINAHHSPLRHLELLTVLPALSQRRKRSVPLSLVKPGSDGDIEPAKHHLRVCIDSCIGRRAV